MNSLKLCLPSSGDIDLISRSEWCLESKAVKSVSASRSYLIKFRLRAVACVENIVHQTTFVNCLRERID